MDERNFNMRKYGPAPYDEIELQDGSNGNYWSIEHQLFYFKMMNKIIFVQHLEFSNC